MALWKHWHLSCKAQTPAGGSCSELMKLLAPGWAGSSCCPARWEHLPPSCCLNPARGRRAASSSRERIRVALVAGVGTPGCTQGFGTLHPTAPGSSDWAMWVTGALQQCWLAALVQITRHNTAMSLPSDTEHLCTAPACSPGLQFAPCRNSINTRGVQGSSTPAQLPSPQSPQQLYFCHDKILRHPSSQQQT